MPAHRQLLRIGVYGTLALAALLFLLHPYSRQSVFGPKIRDLPFCYWQDAFRHHADPAAYQDTLASKALRWFGFHQERKGSFLSFRNADMLPVLLSLVDDPAPRVRELVALYLHSPFTTADECMPSLRRLLDDREAPVRAAAASSLGYIGPAAVESLPRLLELLEDPDSDCQLSAAMAVCQVGEKQIRHVLPVVKQALTDANYETRLTAIGIVFCIGKAAAEAYPEIAACAGDSRLFGSWLRRHWEYLARRRFQS